MAQADDGDEWEYVYDPTETETITFTIDFSTAGSAGSDKATTLSNAATSQISDAQPQNAISDQGPKQAQSKDKVPATVQFLDLPSKSPYISYQGQVFSGTWGDTLGSDLLFASTKDIPSDVTPLVQGKDGKWCLLGVSQTTLVTKPVELIKRSRLEIPPANGGSITTPRTQARKPFTVVLKPDADAKLRRQAAYLEQLQAIKIARGDTDIVYLGKTMQYLDEKGKKKKAPDFTKRDLDKMNEAIVPRMDQQGRKRTRADNDPESEQEEFDVLPDHDSAEEMHATENIIDPNIEANDVDTEP